MGCRASSFESIVLRGPEGQYALETPSFTVSRSSERRQHFRQLAVERPEATGEFSLRRLKTMFLQPPKIPESDCAKSHSARLSKPATHNNSMRSREGPRRRRPSESRSLIRLRLTSGPGAPATRLRVHLGALGLGVSERQALAMLLGTVPMVLGRRGTGALLDRSSGT